MGDDYLPRGDQEFSRWLVRFVEAAGRPGRAQRLRIAGEELGELQESCAELEQALIQQAKLQREAAAARWAKDRLRCRCEQAVRQLTRTLQHAPGIADRDRLELGIRLNKPRSVFAGSAAPATAPRLRVQSQSLRHRLHFVDEQTPRRKAKPPRVASCEIWSRREVLGSAAGKTKPPRGNSAAPSEPRWGLVSSASATPFSVDYPSAEVGVRIWYRCRWLSTRGTPGPWSNTVSALVSD